MPARLLPTKTFDEACDLVIGYLRGTVPLGSWVVTRIVDGRQLALRVGSDGGLDVPVGTSMPFEETMCRTMAAGTTPRIAPNVADVPEYAAIAAITPIEINAYVGTPIVQPDGRLFGTVCGFDPHPQPDSLRELAPLLDVFSSLLSAVLAADLAATSNARDLERARREAETDAPTGLLNRRGWERFIAQEEDRFRRFGDPASVVVIDLDGLKSVNDIHGHDAGDAYIRAAADALSDSVRSGDVLARLGGDEFGIIVPGATPEQAAELVARARRALTRAGVSGSIGHAPYTVVAGFPGAWKAADAAMYVQKRSRGGRHRRPERLIAPA